MKGRRPLTNDEILAVAEQFQGAFEIRNRPDTGCPHLFKHNVSESEVEEL